jgi:hypothetical protein
MRHLIAVVDQSGSMRQNDVAGYLNRSDAVFGTLALDLIGQQLDQGMSKMQHAVTLIEMRDTASIIVEREPLSNALFNKVVALRETATPKSHGNYMPALQLAEAVLSHDEDNEKCALMLLFLSDGRPSDPNRARICNCIQDMVMRFGKRLTIATLGFAKADEDFSVLEQMAETARICGMSIFLILKNLISCIS